MLPLVELTDTTTCKLRLHGLFSLRFATHKLPHLWLWDPTQRFKSPVFDLVATTRFHQHLIRVLVSVNTCRVRRLQKHSDLTEVTHKSFKSLQNIVRVFLLDLEVLDWNPKRFRGRGPNLNFAKFDLLCESSNSVKTPLNV